MQTKILNLKKVIQQLQEGPQTSDNLNLLVARWDLDELLVREDVMWKDKAKARWNEEGDASTHYFHLTMVVHLS